MMHTSVVHVSSSSSKVIHLHVVSSKIPIPKIPNNAYTVYVERQIKTNVFIIFQNGNNNNIESQRQL